MSPELLEVLVQDQAAWRTWLETNHARSAGVRLVLAKKGSREPTRLSYGEALDEALCFGWIDGQVQRRDERTYLQRFTPRRPTSTWSRRNVGHAERLIRDGRMRPAGQAEIDRARADGRWASAYDGPATAEVPADLGAAIDADPAARESFTRLTSQNRFAILFRLGRVKRPETRARKIEEFVAMLARGETIHPQSQARDPNPEGPEGGPDPT
ncbi:MAG: YdeI/OmpD-associated family protein [Actinomycetota bacterium]|nr:YdeI/OmpD-associated family protein [Actinomycetota bacterium]